MTPEQSADRLAGRRRILAFQTRAGGKSQWQVSFMQPGDIIQR